MAGCPDSDRPAAGDGWPPEPDAPDPVLVRAAAMVFVADPAAPVLTEEDAHHLVDVLRLRPGEPVVAADGAGRWAPCRVGAAGPRGRRAPRPGEDLPAVLEREGPVVEAPPRHPPITVGFVPTKGDRPEWVTRRLTELGVDRIVPVRSVRSVVRWDGARGDRAVERLRRVAREAAAQSRRPRLPDVLGLTRLEDFEDRTGESARLAQPGGRPPSLRPPVLVVGPEGGWDPEELVRYGPGVGLGPTVLRAETAAVAAGTILGALRSGLVGPCS